jgi:hypothetical protein
MTLFDVTQPDQPIRKAALDAEWIAFSPVGERAVIRRRDKQELWNVEAWRPIAAFASSEIFASDEEPLWCSDGSKVILFDPAPLVVDADGHAVALPPMPRAGDIGWSTRAARIWAGESAPSGTRLSGFDATTGTKTAEVSVDSPNARWLLEDAIVQRTPRRGRIELRRLSDGARLQLAVSQAGSRCGIVAVDDSGHFDGEPLDEIALRVGADLRTAKILRSGPEIDARRSPGLVAAFLGLSPAPSGKASGAHATPSER